MRVSVGAQTKAAQAVAARIPKNIIGLLVEPALLEGEEPSLYWNLFSAMIDEHQPQSLFDWLALIDFVGKLWDERFYRRATNAIIRSGQRLAVEQFVVETSPGEDGLMGREKRAERRANKYFSANKKESAEVQSQLANYAITEAEILARSAQNNADAIVMFERMVTSRERDRRKLEKEMKRRQSSRQVLPSQEVRPSQEIRPSQEVKSDVTARRLEPRQVMNTEANDNSEAHHHDRPRPSQELERASTAGKGIHKIAQFESCQEAIPDRDEDKQPLEFKFHMIDEVGTHHHGQ
jgi:hypothetical protein